MALNINGTTGISGVDGSASAPAVTGTDSNTGINFGSDTVNINTGGSTRATVDSSGNVGIGTTSPSTSLHNASDQTLTTGTAPQYRLNGTAADTNDNNRAIFGLATANTHFFSSAVTGDAILRTTNSGNLLFGAGQTERMRIDSSGNVLIGQSSSTSPGQGNTTAGIALNPSGRGNFSGTNTAAMLVQRSNDGIAQLLYRGGVLQGNISVSSSGITFNSTSDYRLKENVVAISDGITRLKTLKPSRFNFIADAETTVDGFLAHEVTAVPEAITGIKDAVAVQSDVDEGIAAKIGNPVYQTIDQSKLVPLLTAALQEAIAKIETLETKVAALEAG